MLTNSVLWHGAELKKSTHVYRYFPLHRAIQLFESQELPMILPTKWWDPLEMAWSAQQYQTKRRLAKKTVFGSCWTTGARNDALWQIYSKSAPAIRVRSTVGALIDAMIGSGVLSRGKLHVGKVNYCSDIRLLELAEELASATLKKDVGRYLVKGLMHKREAFQFEDELRILWIKSGADSRTVLNVLVDIRKLVDQVRVDPRLDEDLAKHISSALTTVSGISDVRQSSLARSPI